MINKFSLIWLALFATVFTWSAWYPKDYPTWALEVAPAVIALLVLIYTRKTFPLTPLVYGLILMHCIILMIGGHYTYAEVPLFEYFKEVFGFERNNYDKLGHLAQGFVPAMVAREILLRKSTLTNGKLAFLIVTSIALAISAIYEIIEWWVALLSSEAAEAFLGTQGYVWDTQSDMLMALIGAIVAQLTIASMHNQQLKRFNGNQ